VSRCQHERAARRLLLLLLLLSADAADAENHDVTAAYPRHFLLSATGSRRRFAFYRLWIQKTLEKNIFKHSKRPETWKNFFKRLRSDKNVHHLPV